MAPTPGRRQRRKNGHRVHQALIQNAQHDINRNQRGQNEVWLVLERILERLCGALESGVHGAGHAHVALRFFERRDGVAQGHIRSQIEGQRDCRILSLVVHL